MTYRVVTLILCCLMFMPAGCGGERPDTSNMKVFKVALDQAPTDLEPIKASTIYANHVIINAYDTLYSYKYLARPYQLKPRLAQALPDVSEDGLVYTFKLKQGVRFMDDPAFENGVGRELVAQDVVYSLQRHFDAKFLSSGSWLWSGRIKGMKEWQDAGSDYSVEVEGLRALDKYTVQISLIQPYPQLVQTFAQGYSAIVPREAVEKYGKELSVHPVGSGPFMVTRFDTTRAVLVRNPNYRQEPVDLAYEGYQEEMHGGLGLEKIDGRAPPFVDRIEVNFIAEDTARMTSLTKGGELHAARLPTAQYDLFLTAKDPITIQEELSEVFHVKAGLETAFVYHNFNLDDPDFGYHDDPVQNEKNHALRCAIRKGFDWNERNNRYYGGVGKIFPGIIPPLVPEFDNTVGHESITLDIEGAKKLLSDAGWTADNLPVFIYGIPNSVLQNQYFEQFRGFMANIGYPPEKIQVKQYAAFGDIAKAWKQSRLPMINKAWILDYPDAENTLQLFYGPNHSPGSNDANYRNPDYDAMFEQAATMQPGPERTKIYRAMNRLVIDDCVTLSGLSRTIIMLWNKNIIAYPDRSFVGGFYYPYVDMGVQ